MDLVQPVTHNSYNKIQQKLCTDAEVLAGSTMIAGANRLLELTRKKQPENIVMTEFCELGRVAVTVDGTWQKRGHNSKFGVVFIISVETGEILDYELKNLVCQECTMHDKDDKKSKKYEQWKEKHMKHCNINHEGSSSRMENEGAIEIFLRSIEKRCLIYSTYVGDGDSGSFANVKKACEQKYGEIYTVEEEECVGHIQKRMGSGLREYKRKMKGVKLSDRKGVGGSGRHIDHLIDKIQNNFGEAIRNNINDKKGM